MLQYRLLKFSPPMLRWYRTSLLLDFPRILKSLPSEGKILDVGCGVGTLEYRIARALPKAQVLGIDVAADSIEMARKYHSAPNLEYDCRPLESVTGQFDCILFVDVFHHIDPSNYDSLLSACKRLLTPNGYLMIKDVERDRGGVSLFMDRYISGCRDVFLHNCEELREYVGRHFPETSAEVRYRFPFPHYYLKASCQVQE